MIRLAPTETPFQENHPLLDPRCGKHFVTMTPTWDGICFYCNTGVRLDEPDWCWLFNERRGVWMHLECARSWLPRIVKALEELSDD